VERVGSQGHITAVTSWLLYSAALVVTSMVAVSFGQYGAALFFDGFAPWRRVLTTAVVLVVAAVNVTGARFVDRVRTLVVVVLLSVFAVFVAVALARLDSRPMLAPAAGPSTSDMMGGVALMALAAVLVNANICAATGLTAALAEAGLFPQVFSRPARVGGTRGLVISVVAVLLLANLVDPVWRH
jgi:amino acid transporter